MTDRKLSRLQQALQDITDADGAPIPVVKQRRLTLGPKAKTRDSVTVERLNELFIYDPDTGALTWRIDHGEAWAGTRIWKRSEFKSKELFVRVDSIRLPVRRIAWAMSNGYFPNGRIYHYNGDNVDNRIDNLVLGAPSRHAQMEFFLSKEPKEDRYPYWVKDYLRYDPDDGSLWWIRDPSNGSGFVGTCFNNMTNHGGYIKGYVNGELMHINHICVYLYTGRWPEGRVRHGNRDKWDFRIENLVEEMTKDNKPRHHTRGRKKGWSR